METTFPQPEYETVWAHGANCGIDDLDAIARMDRMDDDFGLDTIEMGATIGVAMEAGLCEFGDAEIGDEVVLRVRVQLWKTPMRVHLTGVVEAVEHKTDYTTIAQRFHRGSRRLALKG